MNTTSNETSYIYAFKSPKYPQFTVERARLLSEFSLLTGINNENDVNGHKTGYLEIILGPMFSGKTTRLIEKYNVCVYQGEKVIAINYSADKRYHDTMLSTHDKKMIPCIFTEKLSTISKMLEIINADIILINEGQFFGDIYEQVSSWVNNDRKCVYVCGLDGDFKQQVFGKLLDLIPLCDSVIKLSANCGKCGKDASFTGRLSNETEQIVIGSDNYVAMCRGCIIREPAVPL